MAIERWGSLSVADHADTAGLVANVLLYDRLVLPVMTPTEERDEEGYWEKQNWNPKLQTDRLGQLGDLAVRKPWDKKLREKYQNRRAELEEEQYVVDPFALTRSLVAGEAEVLEKPPGVTHADVIPAYNSTGAALNDFELTPAEQQQAAQAVLLTRRLAIPDLPNLEDRLKLAIDLSRDDDFRERRSDLFDWQQQLIGREVAAKDAVDELCVLTDAYNEAVRKAHKTVYWKYAFAVVGGAMTIVTGGLAPMAGAAAGLLLLRFAAFDKKPVIQAGRAKPAAMFHDIETIVGAKLKPAQ